MGRGTVQRRRRKSAKRRRAAEHQQQLQDDYDGRTTTAIAGTAGANATWVRTGRRGSDTYLEVLPDLTKGGSSYVSEVGERLREKNFICRQAAKIMFGLLRPTF